MKHHDSITQRLKESGLRLTPQRMLIVQAIENSTDHISAEEIYAQVAERFPNVNISTVYRTLELLQKEGMVTETDLGGGRVRYDPVEKGHHHHLICEDCGRVIDLDEAMLAPLKEVLLRECNFIADLKHVGIFGHCVKCEK